MVNKPTRKALVALILSILFLTLAASFVRADTPTSTYNVTAVFGSSGPGNGQFSNPQGIAVDNAHRWIYVADYGNNRVEKFDLNGDYIGQLQGTFVHPIGVAVDSAGYVYVTDQGIHPDDFGGYPGRVLKFASDGSYVTQWDEWNPHGIAVDGANFVYVADCNSVPSDINCYTNSGSPYPADSNLWNAQSVTSGNGVDINLTPLWTAVDSQGNVYVTFIAANLLDTFVKEYTIPHSNLGTNLFGNPEYPPVAAEWGPFGSGDGTFNNVQGIAVDSSNYVYVVDSNNARIQKFTSSGGYLCQWGSLGSGQGQFNQPTGIAVDSAGNVYVVDTGNNRVEKFSPQYYLTVNDGGASGATAGQGWYNSGATANFWVVHPVVAGTTGIQYIFNHWTGSGAGSYSGGSMNPSVVINNPITESAYWTTQYYLNVDNSGYGTASGTNWYVSGATATFSITPPLQLGTGYTFLGWTGTGAGSYTGTDTTHTVTMNNPITEVASWNKQYYLTVNNGGHGTAGGSGWYNAGTTAQASISPLTVAGDLGVRYVFDHWTSAASGSESPVNILMNGPKTATAVWKTQYYMTVSSAYGSPTPSQWVDSSGTLTVQVTSPQSVSETHRWVCTGFKIDGSGLTWPGTSYTFSGVSAAHTITFYWQEQYYLQVSSGYGSYGGGWYNVGSQATFGANSPVTDSDGNSHSLQSWSGTGVGSYSGSDLSHTVTMNNAIREEASWSTAASTTQYYLTVNNGGYGTEGGSGWYNEGTYAQATITPTIVQISPDTRAVFDGWAGDASGTNSPSNNILMNSAKTATATWKIQYLVTLDTWPPHDPVNPANDLGSVSPDQAWVDAGGTLSISATPASSYYALSYWSPTGAVTLDSITANPTTAHVSGPGTITAGFAPAHIPLLTVSCTPDTIGSGGVTQTMITGSLTDPDTGSPLGNKQIDIYYDDGAGNSPFLASAVTQSDGTFSYVWTPSGLTQGFHTIYARYGGDSTYYYGDASTQDLVGGGGLFVLPEYLFGGLAALAACFVAFLFYARQRPNKSVR